MSLIVVLIVLFSSYHRADFGEWIDDINADALAAVVVGCKPGAKIVDLCDIGDNFIKEYVAFRFE